MEYSAGVIAYEERRYCLIRNTENQEWGFPKGHLEEGETEEQAAHRELYEEAGLRATLVEGFKETSSYVMGNTGKEKTVTFFLGKVIEEGAATHLHEISDKRWCSYEEALEMLPHADAKELLRKAHTLLSERSLF